MSTVELGQQRLLDPGPFQTVPAPRTAGHWGVDPSVRRVSIAGVYREPESPVRIVDGEPMVWRRAVAHREFDQLREGERLAHIYRATLEFARELLGEWGWPGFVWVEQPFAFKHPVPPVSYMAQGVIMAALVEATGAVVDSCKPPATWKSLTVGNGNANKAAVARWAGLNGCPSDLQDDCDAWAIAEAARRSVKFEVLGTDPQAVHDSD